MFSAGGGFRSTRNMARQGSVSNSIVSKENKLVPLKKAVIKQNKIDTLTYLDLIKFVKDECTPVQLEGYLEDLKNKMPVKIPNTREGHQCQRQARIKERHRDLLLQKAKERLQIKLQQMETKNALDAAEFTSSRIA